MKEHLLFKENQTAAAYVAGGLDPTVQEQFELHLLACVDCAEEVESWRALRDLPGLKPPRESTALVSIQGRSATDKALDVLTLAATIATKPRDTAFSVIRLIRAATAGRFSEQLREEWGSYVAAGKIKPDYADTEQAQTIFADTLQSLEDANFDEEQLELLRKLFLAAASETATDRHSALVREYIEVGRTLATGEIRVLSAYWRYLPEWDIGKNPAHTYSAHQAFDVVRKYGGVPHTALIERHERSLIDKGLVRPYNNPGMPQVDSKEYRLTDFGAAFCEFLKSYDRMKDGA